MSSVVCLSPLVEGPPPTVTSLTSSWSPPPTVSSVGCLSPLVQGPPPTMSSVGCHLHLLGAHLTMSSVSCLSSLIGAPPLTVSSVGHFTAKNTFTDNYRALYYKVHTLRS